MDRLSNGTFGKLPETDLEKVIAERDQLRKELALLAAQYDQIYKAAHDVISAKDELIRCLDNLAAENLMLRAALGAQGDAVVKN